MIGRIGERATFASLRRTGHRVRRGPITVTFAPDTSDGRRRAAYAIGRDVGSAVQRNRLRRRLRAIMMEQGPQLAPGDYLLGARPEATTMTFEQLKTSVERALAEVLSPQAPEKPR